MKRCYHLEKTGRLVQFVIGPATRFQNNNDNATWELAKNCCIIKTLGDNRPVLVPTFFGAWAHIFEEKKYNINIATTNGFLCYNDDDNNDEDCTPEDKEIMTI